MERIVYTISEAAEALGISNSYAYMLVKEKRLPVVSVGRRKLIPKQLLEEWLLENVNTPNA